MEVFQTLVWQNSKNYILYIPWCNAPAIMWPQEENMPVLTVWWQMHEDTGSCLGVRTCEVTLVGIKKRPWPPTWTGLGPLLSSLLAQRAWGGCHHLWQSYRRHGQSGAKTAPACRIYHCAFDGWLITLRCLVAYFHLCFIGGCAVNIHAFTLYEVILMSMVYLCLYCQTRSTVEFKNCWVLMQVVGLLPCIQYLL